MWEVHSKPQMKLEQWKIEKEIILTDYSMTINQDNLSCTPFSWCTGQAVTCIQKVMQFFLGTTFGIFQRLDYGKFCENMPVMS